MTDFDADASGESTAQFAARMADTIDAASATLLISIGHQTGLFETMTDLPASTSAEIAAAAGLDERYVREWLGGMVTARIVDLDPAAATYLLPAARAAVLTGAGGERNMAIVAQYIPMLAEVEQGIVGCFRAGGGLPYSDFPRFHAVAAEQSAQAFDAALIDILVSLSPGLAQRLRDGIDVADIGCGSGHAVNLMARAFPASRFTGLDFSAEAVAVGAAEAARLGNANAEFVRMDLNEWRDAERYDLVTAFDTIHDQAQPALVLANVHRALRTGGTLLMADIKASSNLADNVGVPLSTYMYTVSTMHCMTVSLALDGVGLGTAWGRQLAETMLAEAGFADVRVSEIDADPRNYYYVAGK